MLNQPTVEKLHTMKLYGMADAFRTQLETAASSQLSFEERFALLVDQQYPSIARNRASRPAATSPCNAASQAQTTAASGQASW